MPLEKYSSPETTAGKIEGNVHATVSRRVSSTPCQTSLSVHRQERLEIARRLQTPVKGYVSVCNERVSRAGLSFHSGRCHCPSSGVPFLLVIRINTIFTCNSAHEYGSFTPLRRVHHSGPICSLGFAGRCHLPTPGVETCQILIIAVGIPFRPSRISLLDSNYW